MIGAGVSIMDSDFHSIVFNERIKYPDRDITDEAVSIGDGVFIGVKTTILKGTRIGNRSVIGAGSVVSGVIGDDEVWAGNPAVFIKKINNNKLG